MNRKILLFMTVLALSAVPLFADFQFRLALGVSSEFVESPTADEVAETFWNNPENSQLFTGWQWEVILNKLGFGMYTHVRMNETSGAYDYPVGYDDNLWRMDWKGNLFLSYHFFGGGAMLDPFIEVGYGNAGRVRLEPGEDYDPDYSLSGDSYRGDDNVEHLSLYPYLGGGLALDLDGFLLGGKLNYHPYTDRIPATEFAEYPLKKFEVSFFGGIALGGHGGRHR